ncbi:MAG: phenylalanine--tRNA ligase subunit alpha [Candidatus Omnitrophica bacterium]|nr:phenylalanine--tRNA ligase subunit alpha [Candidatus Omnitrophota bacterium]
MFADLKHIQEQALKEIENAATVEELDKLKVKYLSRKGLLPEYFKNIKSVSTQERPQFGKALNKLKADITREADNKSRQLKKKPILACGDIDFTADGIKTRLGKEHIINQTIDNTCAIFEKMGFEVVEGPEVETEFNNFTGLNIPLNHPSRDAFDTFYLKTQERLLLRSHTSPVQIRVMKNCAPPLAVVVPGKVYRPDATDASHSFMFHQIEGFVVSTDIRFSDLKGVLDLFAKELFGPDIKMRFRPHFFPFTEPSAEVDISCIICSSKKGHCSVCGGKGWLEVLGAGMIHPNVFKHVGYPAGRYRGFAFGMGIERIAMLKCGIGDIRLFFENDLRFLEQF